VERKITFFCSPLTNIKIRDGTLYISTAEGHFKRLPASSIGVEQKEQKKESKFNDNLNVFKCPSAVVAFELISVSKANSRIKVEGHQHLAILACYDGFLYVISREMGCEQLFRVSH